MNSAAYDAFYNQTRSSEVPLVVGDTAKVLRGNYGGRLGAVVGIDVSTSTLQFLIEFGDGTDELLPVDNLERIPD